jgi:hypothetical protein
MRDEEVIEDFDLPVSRRGRRRGICYSLWTAQTHTRYPWSITMKRRELDFEFASLALTIQDMWRSEEPCFLLSSRVCAVVSGIRQAVLDIKAA